MGYAMWSSVSFSASTPVGQTVTFTLSGTAFEGTWGGIVKKEWTFYLVKDGTRVTTITGCSVDENWRATFSGHTFSYSVGSGDFGHEVTFSVEGDCKVTTMTEGTFTETTTGNPSDTATFSSPSISWSSDARITATPTSDFKVTVTRTGSANVGGGFSGTVYYRLLCNSRVVTSSTQSSTITDNSPPYDVQLTYELYGYVSIGGNTYTTSTPKTDTTIVITGNYIDYFDGTNWVQCKAYYYDGSSWVECKPFYYDGTSWVECSS